VLFTQPYLLTNPGEHDIVRDNLAQLGLSGDFYAAYLLSMVIILAAVWFTILAQIR
jgi:hypothetical protein